MLTALSIQDIVLIERTSIEFAAGLNVLTGETGAGKSILLDSLGLATGKRADRALVRKGASKGEVTAIFEFSATHPALALVSAQEIEPEPGGVIMVRRQITSDGRSRAWVNDAPVGQAFLQKLGDAMLEIHGQHDGKGLLDPTIHAALLDRFGGAEPLLAQLDQHWRAFRAAQAALEVLNDALERARQEEDFLRHAAEELSALAPIAGEEEELAKKRSLMLQGQKLADELRRFEDDLFSDEGAERQVSSALRHMERLDDSALQQLTAVMQALERASNEMAEAADRFAEAKRALDFDPAVLEQTEERLFELRRLARKHGCAADDLATVAADITAKLEALDASDEERLAAEQALKRARGDLSTSLAALTQCRRRAADNLDRAVMAELPALKLERALFETAFDTLAEAQWGPSGAERVRFQVQTNPGSPLGPLEKVASGGELARLALAIKVVLSQGAGGSAVLVFDEVDAGVGGATASAVGDRLHRVAEHSQVIIVTHSPQVAAQADHHFHITKSHAAEETRTRVFALDQDQRAEEIARMLAGAEITDEARAAAARLLNTAAA